MTPTPLLMPRTRPTAPAPLPPAQGRTLLTWHAARQAERKGFDLDAVLEAANDPTVRYPSSREGQERRIRDGIVAVVALDVNRVVTVYANVVETPLRRDQRAAR